MRRFTLGGPLCALALSLSACAAATPTLTAEPDTLTVFAAASLTDAFGEIGQAFEAEHPGTDVVFNFAGSQSLRTQLEQGALADVFASASDKEMETVVAAGLARPGAARTFVNNQLVVILPADNPGEVNAPADLARPGLKVVLASEGVPVGDYSREALGKLEAQLGAGFREQVLANLVSSEDNVRQVVTKVQLGEADAGIVYTSDAVAVPELKTIAIAAEFNVVAHYPIAALANAPHPDLAAAFVNYVLSPAGQAALQHWGFTPVNP